MRIAHSVSRLALLGTLTLLAACQGAEPLAPQGGSMLLASRNGAMLHSGRERYRDHGGRPSHGGSGLAVVQGEALLGPDGITVLSLTSFRASDPATPAGDIAHVQIKAYAPNGRLLYTRNFDDERTDGPTFTARLRGLTPGVTLMLRVDVDGFARRRNDVVDVGPLAVVLMPDLAVTTLSVPSIVVTGAQTILSATVAELNGQHGASGDCVLSLNGTDTDRANGIWVDAGDVVSCAFTTTFPAAGSYTVGVRVEHVTPADANPANNAASQQVTVSDPAPSGGPAAGPTVSYTADARSGTFTSIDSFATVWTDLSNNSLYLQAHDYESSSGTDQTAMLSGVLSRPVQFPLAIVETRQSTASRLVHSAQYLNVPEDVVGGRCIARGVGTGVEFYLCSDPTGFTSFTYRRASGTVTYQSDSYQKVWNGASYDVSIYVNNATTTTGSPVTYGTSFGFDVRVTDASGTWVVSATVPLTATSTSMVEPSLCTASTFTMTPLVLGMNTCTYSSYTFSGVQGAITGTGVAAAAVTP